MKSVLIRAAAVLLLAALNIAIPQIRSAAPNLIFLLVVCYAFRPQARQESDVTHLWIAVFGGFLLDLYSRSAFGSFMFGLLVVGILIELATATLFRAEPSVPYMAAVIVIGYLVLIAFVYGYTSLAAHWDPSAVALSPVYLNQKIWLDVFLNLIFAGPIYGFIYWLENFLERYERPRNQLS